MIHETIGGPLPAWADVNERRRAHISRVTLLLSRWATAMAIDDAERVAWLDAGRWHDALRDAPVAQLRELIPDSALPERALHGPAAAARLEQEGETRFDVLEAIRWHTVGHPDWGRVGRALYMADFLEPGRPFWPRDRAYFAELVPTNFDGTFRQVIRMRLEWTLSEGHALFPQAVALWNRVR
jgi:2-amino-4-hydroxy-6-hydroxymethyldihydropteridine diphosphokinase